MKLRKTGEDPVPNDKSLTARVVSFLSSLRFTVLILAMLVLLLFLGTLYQVQAGVYLAVEEIFSSWIVTLLPVPLPGGQLLLWLFTLNLSFSFIERLRRLKPRLGLIIGHAGLIVLLLAACLSLYAGKDYVLAITEGQLEDRGYLRDSWDAVLYDPFDHREYARTRLGSSKQLEFDLDGVQIRLEIKEYSRNSRPMDPDDPNSPLEAAAPAAEIIGNIPLLRLDTGNLGLELPASYRVLASGSLDLAGSDQRPKDLIYIEGQGPVGIILEPGYEELPFSLKLIDFQALFYPGTELPASFRSLVEVDPPGFQAQVSMNEPLIYQGYRFYQSSYQAAGTLLPGDLSVFSVQRTPAPWLAYAGSIITVLGFLIHLVQRYRMDARDRRLGDGRGSAGQADTGVDGAGKEGTGKIGVGAEGVGLAGNGTAKSGRVGAREDGAGKEGVRLAGDGTAKSGRVGAGEDGAGKAGEQQDTPGDPRSRRRTPGKLSMLVLAFLAGGILFPQLAHAQDGLEVPAQAKREFSRLMIQLGGRFMPALSAARLIGRQFDLANNEAEDFLILSLMSPGDSDGLALFQIDNPVLFDALQMERGSRGRYSFNQLRGGFQILNSIGSLIEELSSHEDPDRDPLEAALIRLYQQGRLYLQLRGALNPRSLGSTGLEPGRWQDNIIRMIPLVSLLEELAAYPAQHPIGAQELAASPAYRAAGDPQMLQEASALLSRGVDPLDFADWPAYLAELRILQEGYLDSLSDARGLEDYRQRRELEVFELRLGPSNLAISLALTTLVLAGLQALLRGREGMNLEFRDAVLGILGFAFLSGLGLVFLLGLADMVLRILITARPPVSDLASSLRFVGIATLGLAFFSRLQALAGRSRGPGLHASRPGTLPMLSLVLGTSLSLLAAYFGGKGDPFAPLPAVLDTNFWLTVHVITVALGYTFVLLAGAFGNAYLISAIRKPMGSRRGISVHMHRFLLLGLIFTFFGTMLGGFWADQAWGRFWGWDPKENGALMIVLWTALVLHLRPAGLAGNYGIAIASAGGVIVTAFSWFGVNMIGIGMHSYGFDQQAMIPLIGILSLQGMLMILALLQRKRVRRGSMLPEEQQARVVSRSLFASDSAEVLIRLEGATNTAQPLLACSRISLGLEGIRGIQRRVYSLAGSEETKDGGQLLRLWIRDPGTGGLSKRLLQSDPPRQIRVIGPQGGISQSRFGLAFAQGIGIAAFLPLWAAANVRAPKLVVWFIRDMNEPFLTPAREVFQKQPGIRVVIVAAEGLVPETTRSKRMTGTTEAAVSVVEGLVPEAIQAGPEGSEALNPHIHCVQGRLDGELIERLRKDYPQVWKSGKVAAGSLGFTRAIAEFTDLEYAENFVGSSKAEVDLVDQVITLRHSAKDAGKRYKVKAGSSLMEAVLQAGDDFPRSCVAGQCSACQFRLEKGRVFMQGPNSLGTPFAEAGGTGLGCVSYPLEDCQILLEAESQGE